MSIPMVDFLLPDSWFPHDMQAEMLAANVKTPVCTRGLAEFLGCNVPNKPMVYVPAFGGVTLRHVYAATGGNPLSSYSRDKLCLVITPTLNKFSYSKTVHGVPIRVRDYLDESEMAGVSDEELDEIVNVEQGHLPAGFRQDALCIQKIALDTVANFTDLPFTVLASKLSPLSSGKGNIAIFVYFPHGCPFDKQEFLDSNVRDTESDRIIKIRVIPNPVISQFDEPMNGVKFSAKFIDVDNTMFEKAFPLLQHVISASFEGSNLRYIKPNMATKELVGLIQVERDATDEQLASFTRSISKINFNPYIFVTASAENVDIE